MTYAEFRPLAERFMQTVYQELYLENQERIRIKKEATAVKNFEKIITAVFDITYKKGFQAMTMRDLSRRTHMSLGALYGYFSGKEELLAIIQKRSSVMIQGMFERFFEPDDSPLEQLRTIIKAHLFLSEAARPWFYFTFMEAKNLTQSALDAVLQMEEFTEKMLVRILEDGEKKGPFRKCNHLLTASLIKAMQQDWYLKRWKYKKRGISVDAYAEYLLQVTESFCLIPKNNN
jgi:AcrR family transcriptional regulator